MILFKGNQKPRPWQLKEAVANADESFCTTASDDFAEQLPVVDNRVPQGFPILLKLKTVEPHSDPWVGYSDDEPIRPDRLAIFWLLKGDLCLQVANDYTRMQAGDFVLFNDALVHSVVATKTWLGAAWQLEKLPFKLKADELNAFRVDLAWTVVSPEEEAC
jgi:hypothetical protein